MSKKRNWIDRDENGFRFVKVLDEKNRAVFTGAQWKVPKEGEKYGGVMHFNGILEPCYQGLHVANEKSASAWMLDIDNVLWYVEIDSEGYVRDISAYGATKFVTRAARITSKVQEDMYPEWTKYVKNEVGRMVDIFKNNPRFAEMENIGIPSHIRLGEYPDAIDFVPSSSSDAIRIFNSASGILGARYGVHSNTANMIFNYSYSLINDAYGLPRYDTYGSRQAIAYAIVFAVCAKIAESELIRLGPTYEGVAKAVIKEIEEGRLPLRANFVTGGVLSITPDGIFVRSTK